jgi:hypothetical protein
VLKFQTHLYAINSIVSRLKFWKIPYLQNEYLAFRFPASSGLSLKLKISMTSASLQVWPGDLQTAACSTSLLPIGMHISMACITARRGSSMWLWSINFLLQRQFRLSFHGSGYSDKRDNWVQRTAHEVRDVCERRVFLQ